MNEHSFIRSIHRKLPKEIFTWKINDNYAGGVADAYYSGFKDDVWIEYKYVTLPKKDTSKIKLGLSPLQIHWLKEQYARGRNVAVVIGSPEGNIILRQPHEFEQESITKAHFSSNTVDKAQVISFIIGITTPGDRCA